MTEIDLELIETRTGDCGCPEEEYVFEGYSLTIHFEPTGEADAFLDCSDEGEAERSLVRDHPTAAREALFLWAYFTIHQEPSR